MEQGERGENAIIMADPKVLDETVAREVGFDVLDDAGLHSGRPGSPECGFGIGFVRDFRVWGLGHTLGSPVVPEV